MKTKPSEFDLCWEKEGEEYIASMEIDGGGICEYEWDECHKYCPFCGTEAEEAAHDQ